MIGYITLGTNDLDRAKVFYDALLAEMGVARLMEFGDRGYGWAASMEHADALHLQAIRRPACDGREWSNGWHCC